MYTEICEIPDRARQFMALSKSFTLPVGFPYVGMGSSYFASIAFKFMGVDIQPELASELYCYGLKKIDSKRSDFISIRKKYRGALVY